MRRLEKLVAGFKQVEKGTSMRMVAVKVKICGFTNYDDAMAAADMGADMLGFQFLSQKPAIYQARGRRRKS